MKSNEIIIYNMKINVLLFQKNNTCNILFLIILLFINDLNIYNFLILFYHFYLKKFSEENQS